MLLSHNHTSAVLLVLLIQYSVNICDEAGGLGGDSTVCSITKLPLLMLVMKGVMSHLGGCLHKSYIVSFAETLRVEYKTSDSIFPRMSGGNKDITAGSHVTQGLLWIQKQVVYHAHIIRFYRFFCTA